MWNNLNLECPVSDVCEYKVKDGLVLQDLPNLISLLTTSAEVLTEDNPIWTEIKVFHSIQAKYKKILHCDKFLLLLQRVGGCVKKMVLLNLSKTYLDLAEFLLCALQSQNRKILLPSRQQLEFVLIRTQSAAKLICEALLYSRETFCYLIQRLKIGHHVLSLVMATSVTARVNILFKGILVQLFDFYRQLYSWCGKLKKGTWEWPRKLDLPEDLEEWLKPEDSELLKPKYVPKASLDFLTKLFQKNKAVEDHDSDSSSVIEMPADNEEVSILESTPTRQHTDPSDDCGEVIERCQNGATSNENDSTSIKLTEPQKELLGKINRAKTLKQLTDIWDNLDVSSPDLLPIAVNPRKIRLIDKMFRHLKNKRVQVKGMTLEPKKKIKEQELIVKSGRLKFGKFLGLTKRKVKRKSQGLSNHSNKILKPVKTFEELENLYHSLYSMLKSSQQHKKCSKLKKVFKSRKADIKLLIESNEKAIAKKLIFCTSKVFLTRFKV